MSRDVRLFDVRVVYRLQWQSVDGAVILVPPSFGFIFYSIFIISAVNQIFRQGIV